VKPVGILVFALTYFLISSKRFTWLGFDRPAAALFGAVLAVALGALTPKQALGAIDGTTLLLLFGVMGMGAFLSLDGLFTDLEVILVRRAGTPARLLGLLIWSSGLLAALVTNDAVCVLATPLVVQLIRRHNLPPLPFLLALATAANTGSVATLMGNPQNMLCASLGQLSYARYLGAMGPVALMGLAINHGLLWLLFRRELAEAKLLPTAAPRPLSVRVTISLLVIVAVAAACLVGANLAWAALFGFVTLMLVHRRDTSQLWARIDWALLLFFVGLFVAVEALIQSGLPQHVFERFPLRAAAQGDTLLLRLSSFFLLGSNLVSNVPFIVLVRDQMATLPDPERAWQLLAMASTFAGNLTLLGSAANVIVAEGARELGGIGFSQHLRIGLPVALATTVVGACWLAWLG
jgi:Na+/H+ antiporter NhaD/arsenite permease-like protein